MIKTTKNTLKSGSYGNSVNLYVYNKIPDNTTCLDVGCWTGELGEKITKEKHCIVDGIDANTNVLNIAKTNGYRSLYRMNLNNENINYQQLKHKYDVIIFADVLEHTINPEYILKVMLKKINQDGKIIISLPNVAFLLNRLQLLMGKWTYREFGTLDKTHLRFFTIESIMELIDRAGYKIIEVNPYNQFGLLRYIGPLTILFPSIFAYQILLVAQPK